MKKFIAAYLALATLLLLSTTALANSTLRLPSEPTRQAQVRLPDATQRIAPLAVATLR